jgi:hypothetical protein
MPDRSQTPLRKMYLFNRVLKNKHQAVSQGRYINKLEARGLRLEAQQN